MTVSVTVNGSPQVEAQTTYTYRAHDSRLATVTDASSGSFAYAYEPNTYGLVKSVTATRPADDGNGVQALYTVTNTYEPNRNVLTTKENSVPSVPSVVSKYTYSTNALGQRESLTRGGTAPGSGTTAWAYNAAGEVTSADDSDNTRDRAYQFDGIGNRRKAADSLTLPGTDNYTVNALNQYTSVPPLPSVPFYDNDGNMASGPLPAELARKNWTGC